MSGEIVNGAWSLSVFEWAALLSTVALVVVRTNWRRINQHVRPALARAHQRKLENDRRAR